MNITNYKTETETLKKEYDYAIKQTPSFMMVFRDKLTKAILDLKSLEASYPAHAGDIKKCRKELEQRQRVLTERTISEIVKTGRNVINGIRRTFTSIHNLGEAPVNFVKKMIA